MFPAISFLSQNLNAIFQTEQFDSNYFTKSPASDIAIVSDPRLMSQVGSMREDVCA